MVKKEKNDRQKDLKRPIKKKDGQKSSIIVFQPDHTGSMTTVHTSASQNDVNKNDVSGDGDLAEVVVKTPFEEQPATNDNIMWSDNDNVSMDTDLTIDQNMFDQNGSRKPKSETAM